MNKPKYLDRNGNEIDASAALDHRGALRDGCTLRVPFQARDSLSTTQLAVRDATAARDARARAYELYDREIEQMYKGGMMRDTDPTWSQTNPRGRSSEATGEGERGTPRGQQPGDLCTIDGRPGQQNHRRRAALRARQGQ